MADFQFISGCRPSTAEEIARLGASGSARMFIYTAPRMDIPKSFDPRSYLEMEFQAAMGSCTRHMASGCFELDGYWASGGKKKTPQHSRMMAYLGAQKMSGFFGRDQGASIAGAVEWLVKEGLCLESTFPYPGRYTTNIPQAALAENGKYKAHSHSPLRSYQLVWGWLSNLMGGVCVGITWTTKLANCSGIVTPDTLNYSRRDVLGGHAVLFGGWSERKTTDGRNYIWMVNSHGVEYGNRGCVEWHPEAIDKICESNENDLYGVTGATSYDVPRRIVGDWGSFVE